MSELSDPDVLADVGFAAAREGEVRRSCLDIRRARSELDWEPTVSLHQGLQNVLAGLRYPAAD
jgi:nucleoside-diphosphate-sugar epimerase